MMIIALDIRLDKLGPKLSAPVSDCVGAVGTAGVQGKIVAFGTTFGVPSADVYICGGGQCYHGITNASGNFSINAMISGTYTLRAGSNVFDPGFVSVSGIDILTGEISDLGFVQLVDPYEDPHC
jgi:hypothetical protein